MTQQIENALIKLKDKIDTVKSDLDKTDGMISANQERLKRSFKLDTLGKAKGKIEELNKREEELTTEAEVQFEALKKEVEF